MHDLFRHDRLPRPRSLHYSGKKCSGVENAFDRVDELEEEDGTSLSYCTVCWSTIKFTCQINTTALNVVVSPNTEGGQIYLNF